MPVVFGKSFLYVATESMNDPDNPDCLKAGTGIIIEKVHDYESLKLSTPIYDEEGNTLAYKSIENPFGFLQGELSATAAGGFANLWITSPTPLTISVPEEAVWIKAALTPEYGFYRLSVQVDPLEDPAERRGIISLQLQAGGFSIGAIEVIQAGATTGESE